MSQQEPVVYLNGEFVPKSQAKISVFDQGLIFGDGVFDTLVATNGFVFKLEQHVERLFRSAKAVRIDIPKSKEEIRNLIRETIRRSGLRDAYVKIIVTRGASAKPLLGRGDVPTPTLIIFAVPPVGVVSEEKLRTGAKLLSTSIKRSHPDSLDPRIKSLNYQPNMLMRREALDGGADEAICYGFDGYVAEGGAENIWIVKNKVLMTPGHGALEGITRESIFEIVRELGYEARTANLSKYDLYQADEIFLCSTAGGIIPVTEVDRRRVGDGAPGPIAQRVRDRYAQMLRDGRHGTPIFD
jgi:branched-chain amino acid aminotransferase